MSNTQTIELRPAPEHDPDVWPGLILTLIPKVMQEVGAIAKTKTNPQQHYNYRGVDDICNALNPVLAENQITVVPQVLEAAYATGLTKSGSASYRCEMRIRYRFYAADGSYVTAYVAQEAHDMADKASSKAMSQALKYACMQVFMIPTQEVDTDAAHIEMPANQRSTKAATAFNRSEALGKGHLLNDTLAQSGVNEATAQRMKDDFKAAFKAQNMARIEKIVEAAEKLIMLEPQPAQAQ